MDSRLKVSNNIPINVIIPYLYIYDMIIPIASNQLAESIIPQHENTGIIPK